MLGISVRVVRFAFLIALPAYGLSLIVYLWLWLTVPEDSGGEQSGTGRLHSPDVKANSAICACSWWASDRSASL